MEKTERSGRIRRRDFIKGIAVGGAALCASEMIGTSGGYHEGDPGARSGSADFGKDALK